MQKKFSKSYELLKTNQKAHFEGRKRPKNTLLFSFIFKVIIVLVTELFCKKAKERSTFRRGSNQHWNLVFVTNFNRSRWLFPRFSIHLHGKPLFDLDNDMTTLG